MEDKTKQPQPHSQWKDITIFLLIIVYVIALLILHFNYDYVDYGMMNEEDIIIIASFIFLLIATPIAVVTTRKSKSATYAKVEDECTNKNIHQTKTFEIPELPNPNTHPQDPINNEQYLGTGIVGMEVYIQLSKIIGILCIIAGALSFFFCFVTGELLYAAKWTIYSMIGAMCCFINIPFVKALITIVKAAKLYLDNNKK